MMTAMYNVVVVQHVGMSLFMPASLYQVYMEGLQKLFDDKKAWLRQLAPRSCMCL